MNENSPQQPAREPHPRNGPRILLAMVFVLSILAVPVAQLISEVITGASLQEFDVFRRTPSIPNLRDYEDTLAEQSILPKHARVEYQQWLTGLLRRGNSKVVIGRDNWLFYRPSFDYVVSPDVETMQSRALDAIVAFRDTLRRQNVELILLPTPAKLTIYPEYLSERYRVEWGPATNRYTDVLFERLRQNHVEFLDPTELLWNEKKRSEGRLYIPQETHWSPYGIELVAHALAQQLISLGWVDDIPRYSFHTEPQTVTRYGDLYDMLQLPERGNHRFEPLQVTVDRVFLNPQSEPVQPDPASPILLLGDSFTNIFSREEMGWGDHAGLAEHLAMQLEYPIDVIAMNAGGTSGTRQELARRPNALVGKKVVVWQFAARDLANPDSEWKIVDIPLPQTPEPEETIPTGEEKGSLSVVGKIVLVSDVPNPLYVPYTECLTYIKYQVLVVEHGKYDASELLVVFWGMKDAELLPPAHFAEGDVQRLSIEPLSDHPELDHIMRADDTDDYDLTPYWVIEWDSHLKSLQ